MKTINLTMSDKGTFYFVSFDTSVSGFSNKFNVTVSDTIYENIYEQNRFKAYSTKEGKFRFVKLSYDESSYWKSGIHTEKYEG